MLEETNRDMRRRRGQRDETRNVIDNIRRKQVKRAISGKQGERN
jgi:hypothetical protein